jgi:hypothetical protein
VSETIGGSSATGIQLDGSGNIFLSGYAADSDFPVTPDAIVADSPIPSSVYDGSTSAFVVKINPSATAVEFSTLLGGGNSESDLGNAIALDSGGNVYVTGTAGGGFPVTAGVFQPTFPSGSPGNAFVSKLALSPKVQNHYLSQTAVSASLPRLIRVLG